jgi:hypothetical protein
MLKFTKRRGLMVLGVVAALAVAGIALAYWTSGGSGAGSGSAATGLSDVTVKQTSTLNPMYPGDSPQTLTGNFDNGNSGPAYVGTVTATISSVTQASGASGSCDTDDFTLTTPSTTVNSEVPVGLGKGSWTGIQIKFNDKLGTNQDGCKGATVHLSYAVS